MKIIHTDNKIKNIIPKINQKVVIRATKKKKAFYLDQRAKTFKATSIITRRKKRKKILGSAYKLNIKYIRHYRYKQMSVNFILRQNLKLRNPSATKLLSLKELANYKSRSEKGVRTRLMIPSRKGFLGLTSNGIVGLVAKHDIKNLVKAYYANLKKNSTVGTLTIFNKKKVHFNRLQISFFTSLKKFNLINPKWNSTHNYFQVKEFLLFKICTSIPS